MIRMRTAWMMAGVLLAVSAAAEATPIVMLRLLPDDGQIAGQAGTSVGWGFTISADSDFVTVQSIAFGEGTPIGVFSTPGLPLNAASPGFDIVVPWSLNFSGLQYDISAAALLGNATQGLMTLTYDTYSDAGLTDQIGFSDTVNATFGGSDVAAQVTVNEGAEAVGVPEPGAMGMAGLGLCAMGWGWRKMGRGRPGGLRHGS
jgi:hypothetical protein